MIFRQLVMLAGFVMFFFTAMGGRCEDAGAERAPRPRVPLLADAYVTVYESPDPARVYAYSPGITRLPSGRLVATMDQGGPGLKNLPGVRHADGRIWNGKIFLSDDGGRHWRHAADFPFSYARPFVAGDVLYLLGQAGDLMVMRSDDNGEHWTTPVELTQKQRWHQAPCNVLYANGKIYLVMERITDHSYPVWPVAILAPVVMAARVTDDLTLRASWTFSNEITFDRAVRRIEGIGVPFFTVGLPTNPENPDNGRMMAPLGWLETNIVQFTDPDHLWYDKNGRTFYLWMRAQTGQTNLACIAKAVEDEKGRITVSLVKAPSGKTMVYVPCPGGQMKFHILYDDVSRLFWLLSSQSTDSMTRPDRLPADRYNLPNNERHRLALYFSKNCIDWNLAGIVAMGNSARESRHYASMVIDGEDLCVLSRSGDARAKSAHDGNLITSHRVERFRELVY